MQIQVKRGTLARMRTPLFCAPLYEGEEIRGGPLAELDRATGGVMTAALRSGDFRGKLWSEVVLYNPKNAGPKRIQLLGVGKREELDLERIRRVADRAVKKARRLGAAEVSVLFPQPSDHADGRVAQALAEGSVLGAYLYDAYKKNDDERGNVERVNLVAVRSVDRAAANAGIEAGVIVAEAACKARDMVNAPANELTPTAMAERAAAAGKAYGFKVRILERREMERHGMAGILAVSKGSDQPPKFIVMEYDGGGRKAPRYAFVGKGLTFDAGGICIKPAPKMDEMKGDMGGGAAVIGALEAIARLEMPVRVVGIVPATENLLGGSAYRPGDILKFADGTTVMIDNTDAEGRLVLADGLIHAQKFKPRAIVDLATLTGAALIALGQVATAVLGNDPQVVANLKAAGQRCWERCWELPLWPEFAELLRSPIADMKNTGGKHAGTITAAAFLQHFVHDTPWAHLDIAGTSYLDRQDGYRPQGGTGVGVRLLVEYLRGELGEVDAASEA